MAPPSPMTARVCFVSSHAAAGGSEAYLGRLLAELGAAWTSSVVVLQQGPFVERLADPVVVEAGPSPLSMAAVAWRLRAHLRATRPDVVHANGVKAAAVAVPAALGTGVPVVWVKHDFSWDGRLARLIARRCAEVVGVSAAVLRGLPGGVPTSVVPPGIDVPTVTRPPSTSTVVLVGRLHSVKGHRELLAAIPAIRERHPAARFVFVGGDDPSEPDHGIAVRAEAAPLVEAGVVEMAGHQADPLPFMAAADLLVLPSVVDARGFGLEASPLVAIEAMAVGTPVVAYAAGGVPDLLGDCGALVPLGDRAGLATVVADLLGDPGRRDALAACGRARVAERYTAARMASSMQDVYQRAMRAPSRTMGA